ncbi:MAG: metallophosphoesterase [Candidatus Thermoplasmatota archaeon]|nr:metallophosphoesterase [Candidatus Thermoplasmatota archaeon]MBS3790044.1 metallophosphoesterase [Candidatus Thermoplasmatota archaeon]
MQPLWNERIMKFDDTLVIADLHIGYERELEEKGINIPDQSEKMIDKVFEVLKKEDAERLVINGDFKHNVPKATWQEYKDIPKAVDLWLKGVNEIHLLKGNHDGGIEEYLPSDVIIHGSSGTVIDEIGFFHGHANPREEVLSTGSIIIGHCHPTVTLRDSLDNKEKKECWVKLNYKHEGEEGNAIIIPHLNHLLGGISINEDGYLGPFLNKTELYDEKIYLLDGTYLGTKRSISDDQFL